MNFQYIFILLLFFLPTKASSQCPGGVVVKSQQELDSLFSGCIMITGNIVIGEADVENDIHDLSALAKLSEVAGNLVIRNTQIVDLNQLEKLLDPFLEDLSDLNNLERVERNIPGLKSLRIYLVDNPALKTQNLLPGLTFCNRDLQIKNCGMDVSGYQAGFYSGWVELLEQRKVLAKFRWVKI